MSSKEVRSGPPRSRDPVILRVALPVPLIQPFDYRPPVDGRVPPIGGRLRVPFGGAERIGVLIETVPLSSQSPDRLKAVGECIDDEPVFDERMLALLRWASRYYHHPIGETLMTALPARLREGRRIVRPRIRVWRLNDRGRCADRRALSRAPRQASLYDLLREAPDGLCRAALDGAMGQWRSAVRGLMARGWVETVEVEEGDRTLGTPTVAPVSVPRLNAEQASAVEGLMDGLGRFEVSLLYGITGSGKTEVYFRLIEAVIAAGGQALVLVPEIGLTPQLLERFDRRFDVPIVTLHSGMGDGRRLDAWSRARSGLARIVIGTRSAIFTPMPDLGVIILDEEHDPSFKQQEGLRYHARDLAIMRARDQGCPVVLGSATPSLETLQNVGSGRYRGHRLTTRFGQAGLPRVRLIDMKGQPLREGLSQTALDAIAGRIGSGQQVLIFLNRRGFATTLICHACGWIANCPHCDARLVLHRREGRLRCHHCGHGRPRPTACPECAATELRELGQGTERIESVLERHFPEVDVVRIDRDTTRRVGRLDTLLSTVRSGRAQILIGTQLLAKGHHFPSVTLVLVVDADQGLYGSDFRASERMGQLILQVAGRAGRGVQAGEVLLQTYHPEHPLFAPLIGHDYTRFAETLLEERRAAELPPFSHQALLRAEAHAADRALACLTEVARKAVGMAPEGVLVLGPVPASMERKAGRYRAQLLFQAMTRRGLHALLDVLLPWLHASRSMRRVRWSVDVDPVDYS